MRGLTALLSVFEWPADPELDAKCEADRADAIAHMERKAAPHGCLLSVLDCEECQGRVWPEGSMPGVSS